MCGIHGIVSLSGTEHFTEQTLRSMGRVTHHRGPDDEGTYLAEGVALGMRRLSIIDLEGGHQPISNQDRTLWVVCNGEIYNFRSLREELRARGHTFKTGSDSEVIIHAYTEYGDAFIHRLEGMFGFALWDQNRRRLLLGRDRLGMKPLYYLNDGRRLVFASEAKALFQVPGVGVNISPQGLEQYLALGYTPAPGSIFEGVKKLPVASMMVVEDGKTHIERYWRLPEHTEPHRTEADWADALLAELKRAVEAHMVSDVPLGAFLSGGIDSSAIVGLMSQHASEPVKTYAIGFDTGSAGAYYNELPFARAIAERFHTTHREILVRPNVVHLLPKLLWHMDEPIADSAFITTFLVAEFARKDVTVILSGVGGDELFGGYRRYLGEYYQGFYQVVPKTLRDRLLSPIAKKLPADRHSPLLNLSRLARAFILSSELPFEERYRAYVGVYDDKQIKRVLSSEPVGTWDALREAFDRTHGHHDPLRTLFEVDLETQLPDDLLLLTDKMTMATSIECRVPFLDHQLVELAARMPSRHKIRGRELKCVLKKALAGLLPDDVLHRKKRGFGAPMGAWIKNELGTLTDQLLSEKSVSRRGLLDPKVVQETIALHRSNKEDHTDHILALINLEVWARLYLDKQTPEDLSQEIESEIQS